MASNVSVTDPSQEIARLHQLLQEQQEQNALRQQEIHHLHSTLQQAIVANNRPAAVNIRPHEPPTFSGRNQDRNNVDSWMFAMKNYLTVSGVALESNQAVLLCASFLTHDAATWWRSVSESDAVPTTIASFETAFKARFQPFNCERQARNILDNLKQTKSVREYADVFLSTVMRISNMSEEDKIHRFLTGLKQRQRIDVELHQPDTLQKAIILADRTDSILYQTHRDYKHQHNDSRVLAPSPEPAVPMEINNINVAATGGERRTCYYCHKVGHLAKNCLKKKRNSQQRRTTPN